MPTRLLTDSEIDALDLVRRGMWSWSAIYMAKQNRRGSGNGLDPSDLHQGLYKANALLLRVTILAATSAPQAGVDVVDASSTLRWALEQLAPTLARIPAAAGGHRAPGAYDPTDQMYDMAAEMALHWFGVRCDLGPAPDGRPAICWEKLTEPDLDRAVLSSTLETIDERMSESGLLSLERRACEWFFNHCLPPVRSPDDEAARAMREREWALCDRQTMITRARPLDLAKEIEKRRDWTRRRRRVIAAAAESECGVFVVGGRDGSVVTVQNLLDGKRFGLVAEGRDRGFTAGDCFAGRLIPVGDQRWVDTETSVPMERAHADEWWRLFAAREPHSPRLPLAIELERTVSAAAAGGARATLLPPAATPEEAVELLALLRAELRSAFPGDAMPGIRGDAGGPGAIYQWTWRFDPVMTQWVDALMLEGTRS